MWLLPGGVEDTNPAAVAAHAQVLTWFLGLCWEPEEKQSTFGD